MNNYTDKVLENRSQSVTDDVFHRQNERKSTFQFVDNRPETVTQRNLVKTVNNSPQVLSIPRTSDQRQPAQMKWVNNGKSDLTWDQLVDGVQWYYIKETGQMYYQIINAKAIKVGKLEDYRTLENTPKAHSFWKAHRAIDLDITRHLDPSVISPDDVGPAPDGGPTGMAAMDQEVFLTTAKQVETGWNDKLPKARAGALVERVNEYLGAAGVPPISFELKPSDADSFGSFSESTWSITLNEGAFSAQSINSGEMAQMADTVFHEARHAEQFYRIAQMLAALGHSVEQIRTKMILNAPIDANIAAHAHSHPMLLDPNGLSTAFMETLEWYQSLYGARATLRQNTIRNMKDSKLRWFQLYGQMQVLKSELMLLRQELDSMKMDTQFKKNDLKMEYDIITIQIDELVSTGKEESLEAVDLRTKQTELNENFNALTNALRVAAEKATPELRLNAEGQREIKEQMDKVYSEFEHCHELYQQLPEEIDAWALGGSIQEAYKNLV